MESTSNQIPSGSVDPLAQMVVDGLRKSGTRAWLGFPPPEEMDKARAEKDKRDFEATKWRLERKTQRMNDLKQGVRDAIQRSRDEQR